MPIPDTDPSWGCFSAPEDFHELVSRLTACYERDLRAAKGQIVAPARSEPSVPEQTPTELPSHGLRDATHERSERNERCAPSDWAMRKSESSSYRCSIFSNSSQLDTLQLPDANSHNLRDSRGGGSLLPKLRMILNFDILSIYFQEIHSSVIPLTCSINLNVL